MEGTGSRCAGKWAAPGSGAQRLSWEREIDGLLSGPDQFHKLEKKSKSYSKLI
jgi:hypothetical protein